MTAHDLYTRTLSDYKSCLCSSPALTLRSYCRERHVNYHGMCLWLSRHGISIRELHPSSPDMLYGVTITFPDGVTVSIKQGSPFSVNRFIDRYNSKIQEEESCLVELTNKLYQKEHEHCVGRQGWTDKDNLRHRKRYVPQILSEIKRELLRIKSKPDLLPKSEMAGAVDYMLLQWEAIKGIFTEGYYYLDNNLVGVSRGHYNMMLLAGIMEILSATIKEMRVGPSQSVYRNRLQTITSCVLSNQKVVNVVCNKSEDMVRYV